MQMENNKIRTMTSFKNIESNTYPEKDYPENVRLLRGFTWRGDERMMKKEDIFPEEERLLHEKILAKTKIENKKENIPMKIRKETKEFSKKKLKK